MFLASDKFGFIKQIKRKAGLPEGKNYRDRIYCQFYNIRGTNC